MLTSITPLGERSRGQRYGVTLVCFVGGSLLGGTALGLLGGTLGSVAMPALGLGPDERFALLGTLLVLCFAIDHAHVRLPGPSRQVNERWLDAYRGWVYGGGFGAQLGFGVATIVTSASVYLVAAACIAAGSVAGGTIIGLTFGTVRGLTVLPAAAVADTEALMRLAAAFEQRRGRIFRAAAVVEVVALSTGVAVAVA